MTPSRQRALVIGVIVSGVLIVGFFGWRTLHAFRDFRGHLPPPPFVPAENQAVETDVELIRDWMTIPFISRMYQVSPRALFDAVGISPMGNGEKNLAQLNAEYFPNQPGMVLEVVKAAVQANQPPPTPVSPATASPTPMSVPAVAP